MKIHYRTKSGEHYLLNIEPNITMQEVTTKILEQGGLQLSQVSLSMIKNSCKCGQDLTHYLLEETSENVPIEVSLAMKKIQLQRLIIIQTCFSKKPSLLS